MTEPHPVVAEIEAARQDLALMQVRFFGNLIAGLLKPPPVISYYRTDPLEDGRRYWVAADEQCWIPGRWRWKWQAKRGGRKYLDHLLVESLWEGI